MIHALAWCCAQSQGYLCAGGQRWQEPAPDWSESANCPGLAGRTIANYARIPGHARCSLFAASLALRAASWPGPGVDEIGLIGAGYAGCLAADQRYFQDYLDHGRTMGLANMFIYTLPTSALGELAIALKLIGPTQHVHDDQQKVRGLIRHAQRLVAQREADGVLALWSDLNAAVCMAVGAGENDDGNFAAMPEMDPMELARYLAGKTNAGC